MATLFAFLTTYIVPLVVFGLILYLVSLIPLDATVAKIIRIVVIIFIVAWLVQGIFGVTLPHLR